MKILVTGGAGYIGSVCSALALEAGHSVTIFDNFVSGHPEAIPEGADLVVGDVSRPNDLARSISGGFDAVMHLAALMVVPESVRKPGQYYRNNVVGTLNLVDAMREAGVRRLVFSSTAAVYGDPISVPITEDAQTCPTSPYGNTKLAVDRMLSDECAAHGLAAISLRYFNVGGARGRLGEDHEPETHLIPTLLRAAAGLTDQFTLAGTDYDTLDGSAVRDYIHVEDVAAAHLLALEAAEPGRHDIYNLGSGRGHSVREVIAAVKRVTGRDFTVVEAGPRKGDPPQLVASSELVRSRLGWRPQRGLDDIVRDAWEWMRSHPYGHCATASNTRNAAGARDRRGRSSRVVDLRRPRSTS